MPQTVYVPVRSSARLVWTIVLGSLVPVVVPLLVFVTPLAFRTATNVGIVKPAFPFTCGVNDEVSLEGQSYEATGTLITAEVNCKLKIKDCKLKGDVVIHAKNAAEVTLENTELVGKAAAVQMEMSTRLSATKKTLIKASQAGIVASVSDEVSLVDSTIEGDEEGIHASHNFRLAATDARITGGENGLVAAANLSVDGRNLTIQGRDAAVRTESGPSLKLRGGALEGQLFALRVNSSNADVRLSHGARIAARETAVRGESGLHIDAEDCVIDGGEVGVEAGSNAKVTLGPEARVHGGQFAVRTSFNLELNLRSASIESESVALCGSSNAELRARDSSIQGGIGALRFSRRPDPLELMTTRVSGAQQFNAKACTSTGPAR